MSTKFKHRRSLRLKEYSYAQAGAYFVTICSKDKQCIFGKVCNGEMELSDKGQIAKEEWLKTASLRLYVKLDQFVIMPNHFHAILWKEKDHRGTARCAPTISQFGKLPSESLSSIIRAFKAAVTNQINILYNSSGSPVWQRNYYEHVIRDESALSRIREYIINNPLSWDLDRENPDRKGEGEFYRWLASFKTRPKPEGKINNK
jgi:putative transposase